MQLLSHIMHSQVTQQNFCAQARIARMLAASGGDEIGDDRHDEAAARCGKAAEVTRGGAAQTGLHRKLGSCLTAPPPLTFTTV